MEVISVVISYSQLWPVTHWRATSATEQLSCLTRLEGWRGAVAFNSAKHVSEWRLIADWTRTKTPPCDRCDGGRREKMETISRIDRTLVRQRSTRHILTADAETTSVEWRQQWMYANWDRSPLMKSTDTSRQFGFTASSEKLDRASLDAERRTVQATSTLTVAHGSSSSSEILTIERTRRELSFNDVTCRSYTAIGQLGLQSN